MRRPPVPPGEPTGLNQERPGQRTEALLTGAGGRPRGRRLPGSHNPGDGKAVGRANTCEPVIKVVMGSEPKWLPSRTSAGIRLGPKWQSGLERGFDAAASWTMDPPADNRCLPPHVLRERNVETPYASRGQDSASGWERREAGRTACGLGMSEEANAAL